MRRTRRTHGDDRSWTSNRRAGNQSCFSARSDPGADLVMGSVRFTGTGNPHFQRSEMHPDGQGEIGQADRPDASLWKRERGDPHDHHATVTYGSMSICRLLVANSNPIAWRCRYWRWFIALRFFQAVE